MKQILSMNVALVDGVLLEHPTTVFTNDNIEVITYASKDLLNTAVASMAVVKFKPIPSLGEWCEEKVIYAYGVDKAVCVQGHNRMSFKPEDTPALFTVIKTITTDYPVWKQPIGSTDAYKIGDRVHFPLITDPVYESLIAANVWSPTVYPAGWKKL